MRDGFAGTAGLLGDGVTVQAWRRDGDWLVGMKTGERIPLSSYQSRIDTLRQEVERVWDNKKRRQLSASAKRWVHEAWITKPLLYDGLVVAQVPAAPIPLADERQIAEAIAEWQEAR